MKFKVKTSGVLADAKRAINNISRDKKNPKYQQDVITVAYSITDDDYLISTANFGDRFFKAWQYLQNFAQKELEIHELDQEKKDEDKEEEEEDDELKPREAEPTPPRAGQPSTDEETEKEPEEESTELARAPKTDITERQGADIDQYEEVDTTELSTWIREVEEEFKKDYGDDYTPPEPKEVEIVDYYEVLGVDQDASQEEIKKARKKQYRIHHPDVSDLPAEEANEKALLIDEAYSILSDPRARKNYDRTLNKAKRTATKTESGTYKYPYKPPENKEDSGKDVYVALPATPKIISPSEVSKENLLLSITPSQESGVDKELAVKQTREMYENYLLAGDLEYDQETIDRFRDAIPDLPEGKENDVINAGLFTFMQGVDHERIQNAIDQSELTEDEFKMVNSIKEVNQILYAGAPEIGDQRARANDHPEFEIKRTSTQEPGAGQMLISQGIDVVLRKPQEKIEQIISEKLGEKLKDKVGGELRDQLIGKAKDATKKFIKKAAKEGVEKLGKGVAKAGAKKGLTALLSLPGELFGGPIGQAVLAIAIEALTWVAEKVGALIKKLIPESIRKRSKEIAAAGMIAVGTGVVTGSLGLVVVGGGAMLIGGLGSAAGVSATLAGAVALIIANLTAAATGFIMWVTVAVLGSVLLIAVVIYIITTGAYVVPYSPYSLTTGQNTQIGGIYGSAYMDVVKTAAPETEYDNEDVLGGNQVTVTYTISINSLSGTLTNVRFDYECNVFREDNSPNCPPIELVDPPEGQASNEFPEPPETINEGEPYVFSYTQTYQGEDFTDAFIADTITVTADADEQANTRESTGAYVIIGDPPLGCITFTETFPATYRNALVRAAMYLMANYPAYMNRVCAEGPIMQCYSSSDVNCQGCWGQHLHNPHPGCDIEWYNGNGWSGNFENSAFIAAHEWMHHVQRINPDIQENYEESGALVEGDICSYPDWIYIEGTPDIENLAEATGVYVFEPSYWDSRCSDSFINLYPLHYQYVHQNVMN